MGDTNGYGWRGTAGKVAVYFLHPVVLFPRCFIHFFPVLIIELFPSTSLFSLTARDLFFSIYISRSHLVCLVASTTAGGDCPVVTSKQKTPAFRHRSTGSLLYSSGPLQYWDAFIYLCCFGVFIQLQKLVTRDHYCAIWNHTCYVVSLFLPTLHT